MAAVVGPVGINHAQLCHARVAFFLVTEIIAAEAQILKRHRAKPMAP